MKTQETPRGRLVLPDIGEYFDGDFAELEWAGEMRLPEGTVLLTTHPLNPRAHVFEVTNSLGNKAAEGLLTTIEGGHIIEDRLLAQISLQHPIPTSSARHLDFYIEDENRNTRITPAARLIQSLYWPVLAEEALRVKLQAEIRNPFDNPEAVQVLHDLLDYYVAKSETVPEGEAAEQWLVVARLRQDFLDE